MLINLSWEDRKLDKDLFISLRMSDCWAVLALLLDNGSSLPLSDYGIDESCSWKERNLSVGVLYFVYCFNKSRTLGYFEIFIRWIDHAFTFQKVSSLIFHFFKSDLLPTQSIQGARIRKQINFRRWKEQQFSDRYYFNICLFLLLFKKNETKF